MKFALIGHRGTGKTTVLKKLEEIFVEKASVNMSGKISGYRFYDLDQMIEDQGSSVSDIFSALGESAFRKLETETFSKIKDENVVVSLGAGFEGEIPKDFEVIWIRRESDRSGRIFLNRPRLNFQLPPLEEWDERFKVRESRYKNIATQILTLPEGEWALSEVLTSYFAHWLSELDEVEDPAYFATLLPEDTPPKRWIFENAQRVEVRDDLFPDWSGNLSSPSIYFSHRTGKTLEKPKHKDLIEDWDLSLGEPPRKFWSGSSHTPAPPPENSNFEVLKWAPEVLTMADLVKGHKWWQKAPQTRSFLPRSKEGKWRWYRQLFGSKMKVHFVRDYHGSAPDQPFEYEHSLIPHSSNGFAAVLGADVSLSLSPSFHFAFFKNYGLPFFNISLQDFKNDHLILKDLGLRFAAVTSPFKEMAFEIADEHDEISKTTKSCNTLVWFKDKIHGFNTDYMGLKQTLSNQLESDIPVCVWGGRGVLSSLKALLPTSEFVPARQGQSLSEPTQIIWASLRSPDVKLPTPLNYVQKVIDLNYSAVSLGLELAQQAGCEYVSGLEYFEAQAKAQQHIWRKFL